MNISEFHTEGKDISAKLMFKMTDGNITALRILKDALLKEHVTKVPALLVCVSGEVVFENEQGLQQSLHSGDFIAIEPLVVHWVKGIEDSQLLLVK